MNKRLHRNCIMCGKRFQPTGKACKLCDACFEIKRGRNRCVKKK
jgi:hypothetical protein